MRGKRKRVAIIATFGGCDDCNFLQRSPCAEADEAASERASAVAALPEAVFASSTIYEMTLDGQTPSVTFLNTEGDLERFRVAYQELLAVIQKEHLGLPELDLFLAVPAPIAVLCGRELLPKVHPRLRVFDRSHAGWTYQLTVGQDLRYGL